MDMKSRLQCVRVLNYFQITALQIIMLWYELQRRGVGQKSMEYPVDLNCGRVE